MWWMVLLLLVTGHNHGTRCSGWCAEIDHHFGNEMRINKYIFAINNAICVLCGECVCDYRLDSAAVVISDLHEWHAR